VAAGLPVHQRVCRAAPFLALFPALSAETVASISLQKIKTQTIIKPQNPSVPLERQILHRGKKFFLNHTKSLFFINGFNIIWLSSLKTSLLTVKLIKNRGKRDGL